MEKDKISYCVVYALSPISRQNFSPLSLNFYLGIKSPCLMLFFLVHV
jgi:hypothetical protein